MNRLKLKKALKPIFTHEEIAYLLKDEVSNVNAKISYMVKQQVLVRLKKGIYIFSELYQENPVDIISVANLLYAPSYVSFDYALSYYGLIPERVYEITSATLHAKKLFETPLGRFSYRPIPLEVYALGVDWIDDEINGGKFIATPEKALCDKIRGDRGVGRLGSEEMKNYLLYDLRIDSQELLKLDALLIEEIAKKYKSYNLKSLSSLIKRKKYV